MVTSTLILLGIRIPELTQENVFFVANRPMSLETKHQEIIVISAVEAEYMIFTYMI